MNKEIEKIIVDIIQKEMNLPDNWGTTKKGDVIPCVIIYSQNIKLFNTEKLQITVKSLTAHTYSNRIDFIENPQPSDPDGNDAFLEVQDLNQSRMIQVDVYSKNNDARQRFWEVAAALKSTYAQQQQELYQFKIGTMTNDVNLSGLDGGSDVNRFTLTFNVLIHYQKSKPIAYYDKFQTDLHNEQGKFSQINIGE